jgi:N-acetylglucosamine-6-sulfatase
LRRSVSLSTSMRRLHSRPMVRSESDGAKASLLCPRRDTRRGAKERSVRERETFFHTRAVLVVAVLASLLLSGGCLLQEPSTDKPNIVLILTDDQDTRSLDYMPRVKAQLIDRGTTFDNGFVTDPLCCPSRASILRGQYVHNHKIRGNTAPDAHDRFRDLGLEDSTVATWLHEGGYRTALIGKYMNAYNQSYIPPGWDYWFAAYGYGKYRKYNDNETLVDFPDESPSTDVLADKLLAYLESTEGDPKPFFLYLATIPTGRPPRPRATTERSPTSRYRARRPSMRKTLATSLSGCATAPC